MRVLGYSAILLCLVVCSACNVTDIAPEVLEVKSESQTFSRNGKTIMKRYFVVQDPPSQTEDLKALIDKPIAMILKETQFDYFDLHLYFHERTRDINENFVPFEDDNCFIDCEYPVHIWDAAYDLRVAAVYIKKDACQIYYGYFFNVSWMYLGKDTKKLSSREILDKNQCLELYGYVPSTTMD